MIIRNRQIARLALAIANQQLELVSQLLPAVDVVKDDEVGAILLDLNSSHRLVKPNPCYVKTRRGTELLTAPA